VHVMMFVSPHLDDAVLSCGGLISSIVRHGGRAVVVSVFTGDAPSASSLGPLAVELHRRWGLAEVGVARRREDLHALSLLGAEAVHLGFHEVIYRRDRHGAARCQVLTDLFSAPTEDDQALTREVSGELLRLIEQLRPWGICAPAGVGDHVDHLLTRTAVAQAIEQAGIHGLLWYEEMPYASTECGAPSLKALLHTAVPLIAELAERDWQQKLAAIRSYESQLPSLWRDQDWCVALGAHSHAIGRGGLVERLWLPVPSTAARQPP
jgi:LmbE family N-acetylglucosaminyl deacetylase